MLGVLCLLLSSCQSSQAHSEASVEISRVPPVGQGSPDVLETIEGRATGAQPGERIVLFAQSGVWWVQPMVNQPFTTIQPDSTWKSSTHPGSAYAALLVDSRYRPPATLAELPEKGGPVLAVAVAKGGIPHAPPATLQFSGYQWEIRKVTSDRGGTHNFYDPANAWTDKSGFLHLSIERREDRWTSAEIKLSRSLGYGSYRFVVGDVFHLEPAGVFSIFTWDSAGPSREMDLEISRWGEPSNRNAQYAIQPYTVPANTLRFTAPTGRLTYWIDWQPGQVAFRTLRGATSSMEGDTVAEHIFTSGVPSPGNESINLDLYVFNSKRSPLRHGCEVIVEKFEFLP
jgi:hypothetical protein